MRPRQHTLWIWELVEFAQTIAIFVIARFGVSRSRIEGNANSVPLSGEPHALAITKRGGRSVGDSSSTLDRKLTVFRSAACVERDTGFGRAAAKPMCDALREWMIVQRKLISAGSAITKALDYSVKRWEALTRYLGDWHVPVDNNWVKNQIRP
jgi:hypothetical protein